jgi:uncharacterized Zn-binding protein involved in type VI secretion
MADAGATRKGLDTAGGVLIQGSPNVFVNGAASVRIGDAVAGHGNSPHSSPRMVTGSSSVFINKISACRRGDRASCGHRATGSFNVFIGTIPGVRVLVTQNFAPIITQSGLPMKEQGED